MGRVPPPTLARLLSRSDLHIYLTAPFVLSWSLMNALACGATVLASATPPVHEMIRHNENGLRVAEFLEAHPRVDRVYYPGLKSHPTYEIAAAQMRGFGGLITFTVKDADWKQTSRIVDAAKIPRIAPSLGGVESLIEQPLVMSYYHCTPEERQTFGIKDNMIRMSCGIENTEDLIADLQQALRA